MPRDYCELKIPVSYGEIAAKAWGSQSDSTMSILALHGWQDNAGSFDRLIPLLDNSYYIVAIDFPGHGLSSHIPTGSAYNDLVFLLEVKRIVDHLNLTKFTILGHSMGAAIGMFFSCLFPKLVERVISIDMVKPLSFPAEELAKRMAEGIKYFIDLEEKSTRPAPVYDREECRDKLIGAHSIYGVITHEAADCLLKRGVKKTEDGKGAVFTRDNRLKAILFQRMDTNALYHYMENIDCELLIIKANKGIKIDSEEVDDKFIELYKKKCKKFEYATVEGGHHVHLCDPDRVAPIIKQFLDPELVNSR